MLDRVKDVVKNKNRVEKARKIRQKNEITNLRENVVFKAELHDEIKHIDALFSDQNVDAIKIRVPKNSIAMFSAAIYSEDLSSYSVEQGGNENANEFTIRRKFINF